MNGVTAETLIEEASIAMEKSYSPYSKFKVGAAIVTECGRIFTGCNVENASYPCCICAEQTTVCKAVSAGFKNFAALAVIGDSTDHLTPCGMCRQVLREFSPKLEIFCANREKEYETSTLDVLLSRSFGPSNLK